MQQLAVVGEKVSTYSLSPLVHNFWLKKYNLPYSYVAYDIDVNNLANFMDICKKDFLGFNVTIPFKSEILQYLSNIDEIGIKTQSINVVKNINGQLHGFNTDMKAFINQFDLTKKYNRIVILGAGGVAKSIVVALINFFSSNEVFIVSRKVKNENFTPIFSEKIFFKSYSELPKLLETTDLIINTTPISIIDDLINIKDLSPHVEIFDVNYIDSSFHCEVRKANIKILNGLNMFIEQAKYSFHIWFNILPDAEDIRELIK